MFELSFDLSVHDMMVSWINGAHLIVPSRKDLASPAEYITGNGITCWFSVPSLAYQICLSGDLPNNIFPSLRWSLFCGEALSVELAGKWKKAAPGSTVENWYGPTEATIACSRFEVSDAALSGLHRGDLMPIGKPFEGMGMVVSDESNKLLPDGEPGELLLFGRQVCTGYLSDPQRTAASFIHLPDREGLYYRTGDRVVRRSDGNIIFLGRMDNQVKIRGFRVELGAVETVFRNACNGPVNVVALSWPPGEASGKSIVMAVEGKGFNVVPILGHVREKLPEYMFPSRVVFLDIFPVNANGKTDRKGIASRLEKMFLVGNNEKKLAGLRLEEDMLLKAILQVSPNLDPDIVQKADSLLAAGMDSLSFVMLTHEMEMLYRIELTPEDVVQMAEMPFTDLVMALSNKGVRTAKAIDQTDPEPLFSGIQAVRKKATTPHRRSANRVLQFIERFPALLRSADKPFVFAVGSSGTYRCFFTNGL